MLSAKQIGGVRGLGVALVLAAAALAGCYGEPPTDAERAGAAPPSALDDATTTARSTIVREAPVAATVRTEGDAPAAVAGDEAPLAEPGTTTAFLIVTPPPEPQQGVFAAAASDEETPQPAGDTTRYRNTNGAAAEPQPMPWGQR